MSDPPLVVQGGQPAFPEGPPGWPRSDPAVESALQQAYRSGAWGAYQGGLVERLEAELCREFGVAFASTCCSGTIAVELALRAAGVRPEDEVILAAYDFPGNFRAIEAVGAVPVLADLGPRGWTPTVATLAPCWSERTRAMVVSHLHGDTAEVPSLLAAARQRGVIVIEDACQAPGACLDGRPLGALGDIGVLSFGGSKLLTAGRGGALLTNDARLWQRAKLACERGNHAFPLSELQAAVLLPQVAHLAEDTRRRWEAVRRLESLVADLELLRSDAADASRDEAEATLGPPSRAFYKLGWTLASTARRTRREVSQAARSEGVALDAGFRGFVRRTPRRCRIPAPVPEAERAAEQTLVLHHPILLQPEETLRRLADVLRRLDRWAAA